MDNIAAAIVFATLTWLIPLWHENISAGDANDAELIRDAIEAAEEY